MAGKIFERNGERNVHMEAAVGWVLGFQRVLIRSPTEGSRVEEEAGFSFYLFLWIIYWFCFPLCNIVQAICIDWENAFYTVFHNKVLNVHTDAASLCFYDVSFTTHVIIPGVYVRPSISGRL